MAPAAASSDLRQLISLALPIMASSMLTFLMTVVDLLFVGRLGTHELASAALANTLWQTVALPLQGCASALDTLLSQTYGAGQHAAYGRWATDGTLLMLALGVPFMAILACAEPILLGIRQEPALSASAAAFSAKLVWGVPPYMAFMTLQKHLQTQEILLPLVLIAMVANVANAAANWLLIYRWGLGLDGAPLATTLSRWLQLLLLCGYMASARARLGATLPSRGLELERLPARAVQFFRLGAPGALMLALEAWAFDFSTFMAGLLGQTALDAHVRSATPHATHTNPHATRQPRSPGVARSVACAARLPLARGLSRHAPGAPCLAGGAAQHHLVHLYELPICNGRRRVHPRRPRSRRGRRSQRSGRCAAVDRVDPALHALACRAQAGGAPAPRSALHVG